MKSSMRWRTNEKLGRNGRSGILLSRMRHPDDTPPHRFAAGWSERSSSCPAGKMSTRQYAYVFAREVGWCVSGCPDHQLDTRLKTGLAMKLYYCSTQIAVEMKALQRQTFLATKRPWSNIYLVYPQVQLPRTRRALQWPVLLTMPSSARPRLRRSTASPSRQSSGTM